MKDDACHLRFVTSFGMLNMIFVIMLQKWIGQQSTSSFLYILCFFFFLFCVRPFLDANIVKMVGHIKMNEKKNQHKLYLTFNNMSISGTKISLSLLFLLQIMFCRLFVLFNVVFCIYWWPISGRNSNYVLIPFYLILEHQYACIFVRIFKEKKHRYWYKIQYVKKPKKCQTFTIFIINLRKV